MKKDPEALLNDLTSAENLDRFIQDHKNCFTAPSVPEALTQHLERSPISKAGLARAAGMSEVYLHQILSGKRLPSRDRVLSLCVALEMPLAEVQQLLTECSYARLYVYRRRDAVIIYAIVNHWDVYQLNEKLIELGEAPLF